MAQRTCYHMLVFCLVYASLLSDQAQAEADSEQHVLVFDKLLTDLAPFFERSTKQFGVLYVEPSNKTEDPANTDTNNSIIYNPPLQSPQYKQVDNTVSEHQHPMWGSPTTPKPIPIHKIHQNWYPVEDTGSYDDIKSNYLIFESFEDERSESEVDVHPECRIFLDAYKAMMKFMLESGDTPERVYLYTYFSMPCRYCYQAFTELVKSYNLPLIHGYTKADLNTVGKIGEFLVENNGEMVRVSHRVSYVPNDIFNVAESLGRSIIFLQFRMFFAAVQSIVFAGFNFDVIASAFSFLGALV